MDREEFMDIVYSELESDPDNNRANRIIEAADEYAESAQLDTDLISRQAAIDAFDGHFAIVGRNSAERIKMYIEAVKNDIRRLPPAQPEQHTYRGVTLNDVMIYFDSMEGNEDAWTEFQSCFECRGWGFYRIQSARPEPCEDAVSRQAAIAQMQGLPKWNGIIADSCVDFEDVISVLENKENLPPVTPKQRIGYWYPVGMVEAVGGESAQWGSAIAYHKCSECDEQALKDDFENEVLSEFCPHCGAKMEGVAE